MIFRVTYHSGDPPIPLKVEIRREGRWIDIADAEEIEVVEAHEYLCTCIACEMKRKAEKEVEGVWHRNVLREKA